MLSCTSLPAILLALAGCTGVPLQESDLSVNAGLSALPNLGFTVGLEQVFRRAEGTSDSLELLATLQPWDDEDILSDGNPSAGNFAQFQLGVKRDRPLGEDRWWTTHGGVVWFRATGEPNIVQKPGDYLGVYGGVGFQMQVTKNLSIGPDLSLLLVSLERSGEVDVVPQLAWRVTFGF
jgi:hypothetical protein